MSIERIVKHLRDVHLYLFEMNLNNKSKFQI